MQIYYAVLAFLCTASLVAGMGVLAAAMLQIRRTARQVEVLAEHVDERVESLKEAGEIMRHFSSTVRSGWVRGAEIALGVVSALRRTRAGNARRAEAEDAEDAETE